MVIFMVKFSVIVPIYKVEQYLESCIDSVLSQSYKHFELFLIDDGSPDKCGVICDQYAQDDVRITVIHQKNGGVIKARRTGIDMAKGDYIVCIDGDDWVQPNYFENLAHAIEQYNADIVCCGYMWGTENNLHSNKLNVRHGYYTRFDIENEIFPQLIESEQGKYFPPMIWAKAIKSSIFKARQIDYHGKLKSIVGEDHALIKPCIYAAQSCVILEDCLYNYRVNPTSVTHHKSVFSKEGPILIGQHFERLIDMNAFDFQDQVYRNVVHNVFNVVMSQFNRSESYQNIKNEIKEYLKKPYIQNAIRNCRYKKNIKGTLALLTLKYKLYFLIKIYNIIFYMKAK